MAYSLHAVKALIASLLALMRYLLPEEGFWSKRISDLTLTSLKFELLQRSCKQVVTMSTDLAGNSAVKIGSFVMYNCSRLATLFSNYEQQVEKGKLLELVCA